MAGSGPDCSETREEPEGVMEAWTRGSKGGGGMFGFRWTGNTA